MPQDHMLGIEQRDKMMVPGGRGKEDKGAPFFYQELPNLSPLFN